MRCLAGIAARACVHWQRRQREADPGKSRIGQRRRRLPGWASYTCPQHSLPLPHHHPLAARRSRPPP